MAILGALVGFCYLIAGFTDRQLVERVSALLGSAYTCRQATYGFRRLKRKGLIAKVARSRRYQLTGLGRRALHENVQPRACAELRPSRSPSTPRRCVTQRGRHRMALL